MKKIILSLIIVVLFYVLIGNVSGYMIPDEAIRIRVIANSNSEYDQNVKNKVKENLELKMYDMLKNSKGIEEARYIINNNLNDVDNSVNMTLQNLNYDLGYKVNYGLNYFPSKEFKGTTYEEGYYESLVVTLGNGLGENFWCVLFPPLCLLEAEEQEDVTDVEYSSFIKEVIDKYFS